MPRGAAQQALEASELYLHSARGSSPRRQPEDPWRGRAPGTPPRPAPPELGLSGEDGQARGRAKTAPAPGLRTSSFLCWGFMSLPVFHFKLPNDHPQSAAALPGGLRPSRPGVAPRHPRWPCLTGRATRPAGGDTHEGTLLVSPETKRHRDRVGNGSPLPPPDYFLYASAASPVANRLLTTARRICCGFAVPQSARILLPPSPALATYQW